MNNTIKDNAYIIRNRIAAAWTMTFMVLAIAGIVIAAITTISWFIYAAILSGIIGLTIAILTVRENRIFESNNR